MFWLLIPIFQCISLHNIAVVVVHLKKKLLYFQVFFHTSISRINCYFQNMSCLQSLIGFVVPNKIFIREKYYQSNLITSTSCCFDGLWFVPVLLLETKKCRLEFMSAKFEVQKRRLDLKGITFQLIKRCNLHSIPFILLLSLWN